MVQYPSGENTFWRTEHGCWYCYRNLLRLREIFRWNASSRVPYANRSTYFELRTGGIIITPSKSRERTRLQQETSEGERGGERESAGTGILFEEPNPTGSRPRGLIGLYIWHQEERPQPAKRSNREEGGGDFIQEGNRAPVSKATHERGSFKRESVFFRRYASSRFWTTSKRNQTLRGLLTTALLSSTL